jgi:hypothetical protein
VTHSISEPFEQGAREMEELSLGAFVWQEVWQVLIWAGPQNVLA